MKIAFLDTETMGNVNNLNLISDLGETIFYPLTSTTEILERMADVDIAITCKVIIDKKVIDHAQQLKLICAAATGVNHIDVDYATSKGIVVKNVADYSTHSVAQATFALILALLNQTSFYDNYVKNGYYSKHTMFTYMGKNISEINNKIFGIIGMGAIGKKVAQIAEAFGAKVCYYSTSGKNTNQPYSCLPLEELLSTADIISIHAPLNENTRNLINSDKIKLMKPSAILINAARGGIVDEYAVAKAIDNQLIAGYGCDVFSKEPIEQDNPLLSIKNSDRVIFSPHNAWTSYEARTRLIEGIAQNITEFLNKSV